MTRLWQRMAASSAACSLRFSESTILNLSVLRCVAVLGTGQRGEAGENQHMRSTMRQMKASCAFAGKTSWC